MTIASQSKLPLIANVAHHAADGGFFSNHLSDQTRWMHLSATESAGVMGFITRPDFSRFRGCCRAAYYAIREQTSVVVTHNPMVAFPTALALRAMGYRGHVLAFSFNYSRLPRGIKRLAHRAAFGYVDRFVVYSTMEKRLYHEALGIPLDRIDFIHWGVNAPQPVPDEYPLEPGEYICALGENSRDYATLLDAMRLLKDVRLIIVARPHNLVGLNIPSNVTIRQNIPLGHAMNILKFSRFMVLPLAGAEVPCGHVTIVSAMHLGKAFVITESSGASDYVFNNLNAIAVPPGDPRGMAEAIRYLWLNPERVRALGAYGKEFALQNCTEQRTLAYFKKYLTEVGVLIPLVRPDAVRGQMRQYAIPL